MRKITFVKRWETRHSLYKLEGALAVHIKNRDIPACDCENILMSIRNGVVTTYYDDLDLKQAPQNGYRIINNRKRVELYLKEAKKNCERLMQLSKGLKKYDLIKISNNKLLIIYNEYFDLFSKLFGYYNLSRPDYLKKVEAKIREEISKKEEDEDIQLNIFSILTSPVESNLLTLHNIEQIKLALAVKKNIGKRNIVDLKKFILSNISLSKRINRLVDKYCWITTQEENPPIDVKLYISKIEKLRKISDQQLVGELKEIQAKKINIIKERKQILRKYRFSKILIDLCDSVTDLAEVRWKIRFWWTESSYYSERLFAELDRRMGFKNKLTPRLWNSDYLLKGEILSFLSNKKYNTGTISPKERYERSVLLLRDRKINLFIGKEADSIENSFIDKKNFKNIKQIQGRTANKGVVCGRAWVITPSVGDQVAKANKMKKGDILIAPMTRPQFMEAINKASAIVTDEGGITCHAAIISREFGIPCIVSTHFATKVLQDGDLIEVNADKGVITRK